MMIPYGTNARDWFSSLLIDFPDSEIPILQKEEDWREIGNNIKMSADFDEIPDTSAYNNWRDWAYDFYYVMEAESQVNLSLDNGI